MDESMVIQPSGVSHSTTSTTYMELSHEGGFRSKDTHVQHSGTIRAPL